MQDVFLINLSGFFDISHQLNFSEIAILGGKI